MSGVGSPWRDALPYYVCTEHGARPVTALAPEPRRTRTGPCAPAAPCCKRRRARQLRTTDMGLNMNCRYHYEANRKKTHGNERGTVHTPEFLFFFLNNKGWEMTSPLLKKREHTWSKMRQSSWTVDTERPVCSSHQPTAGKLVRKSRLLSWWKHTEFVQDIPAV